MHNLTMFDHADADPDAVRTVKTWLTAFHSCCGCHGYHWHPLSCPSGTIEYEAQLRHENEMKRLQAEMKERGRMERENHDLNLEKIKVKAAEDRVTVLESVK